MEEQRLKYLLQQYLAEKATAEELEELSNTMRSDTDSGLFKTLMAEMMRKETPSLPSDMAPWRQMELDIVNIDRHSLEPLGTAPVRVLPLYRWSVAAAVLLLLGLATYFWADRMHTSSLATTGTTIRDSVISTARGEQREVTLPDGSHIWLNSASSIRFPVPFPGPARIVELSGEAFFDVKHAGRIPFLIHSGAITTTVLGTTFDVTAYPQQENIRVAVQSGKVKVESGNKVLALLEKGRQIKISSGISSSQMDIDTSSIATWRTGELVYKDEMLGDIIADMERTFTDSIEIRSPSLKKLMITFSFDKKNGLENALEMICRTSGSRLSKKNGFFTIE